MRVHRVRASLRQSSTLMPWRIHHGVAGQWHATDPLYPSEDCFATAVPARGINGIHYCEFVELHGTIRPLFDVITP